MVIETNKDSIKETFNRPNYAVLGRYKKIAKLATVRMLPEIIRNGKLELDNVDNLHNPSDINKKFAYITYETIVDGNRVSVTLDIKKSPKKNKLWVHRIGAKKLPPVYPQVPQMVLVRAIEPMVTALI